MASSQPTKALLLLTFLFLVATTSGFIGVAPVQPFGAGIAPLQPAPSSNAPSAARVGTALGVTAAEILAKARKAAGVGDDDEALPPKLFSDEVYSAIQTSLTLVDKRVSGKLTRDEAISFIEATNEIIMDLNRRVDEPHPNPRPTGATSAAASTVVTSPPTAPPAPPPPAPPVPPVAEAPRTTIVPGAVIGPAMTEVPPDCTPDEEYTGGGLGQVRQESSYVCLVCCSASNLASLLADWLTRRPLAPRTRT